MSSYCIMNVHDYVNDDSFVSVWQDGSMADVDEQPGTREVDSVEALRALADPVRLAILAALNTRDADGRLPVLAVKPKAVRFNDMSGVLAEVKNEGW